MSTPEISKGLFEWSEGIQEKGGLFEQAIYECLTVKGISDDSLKRFQRRIGIMQASLLDSGIQRPKHGKYITEAFRRVIERIKQESSSGFNFSVNIVESTISQMQLSLEEIYPEISLSIRDIVADIPGYPLRNEGNIGQVSAETRGGISEL